MPKYRAIPSVQMADLRRQPGNQTAPTVEELSEEPEEPVEYRELQSQAKELGIPANQSREDLEKAIEAADE